MARRSGLLARLAAVFSPSRAPERPLRLRFAGAQMSRLTGDMATTPSSADRANEGKLERLRARVAEMRRDNPLIARYATLCVENILGPDGITLQSQVPSARGINTAVSKKVEQVWYEWAESAGVDGSSWFTCCAQLVESWRLMGECLGEIVIDRRLPMGIALKVLDVDLIDDRHSTPQVDGKGWISQGVEYDELRRPVALHLLTRHRTDTGPHFRRRVPLDRLLYLAHKTRPMQSRGVSPVAPAMLRLQMLNGMQEALVELNRAAATKMGFLVTKGDGSTLQDPDDPEAPVQFDAAPLSIEQLPQGMEFQAWDPGQPTAQHESLYRTLAQEIAGALGVSYAALSGDLGQTSYSSGRIGTIAERDAWRVQQQQFATAICDKMLRAVLQVQLMRGALVTPAELSIDQLTEAIWHGRKWDWVDPAKDLAAIRDGLALGLTTLTRELNARGYDLRAVLEEAKAERELAESLGLRLTFGAMQVQQVPPPSGGGSDTPDTPETPDSSNGESPPRLVAA